MSSAYVASYDKEIKVIKILSHGSSDIASRAAKCFFVSSSSNSNEINVSGIGATMNVNQNQIM